MKRISRIFLLLLLPILLFSISAKAEAAPAAFRAMWISSVYNLDYPSKAGLSAAKLQAEADSIIQYAKDIKITDLFLQVRSSGDALYASDIFPWSAYLSGNACVAADGNFDPLAYFIQQGHAAGIRIHAWVNPYILTRQKAASREAAFALLTPDHPARNIPQAVVYHTNGQLYLDLGHPDARALILAGIQEILDKYDVDGIHFDDYFYPDSNFDDAATYAQYGNDRPLAEFRRDSVNDLVNQIYATVHQASNSAVFGISPSGIWANESSNPLGSETAGKEAYYAMYADSRKWITENMVDYLIPQIYWHTGHESADFTILANWWNDVAEGSRVKLYLGLGAYRMQENDKDPAWEGIREISRQLELCKQLKNVSGVAFYRYGSCKTNPALTTLLQQTFAPLAGDPTVDEKLPAIKDAFQQKTLALVSPVLPAVGVSGEDLTLKVSAPSNSRVTAYYQDTACTLQGNNCDYTGTLTLPAQSDSAPVLLVCETAGLVQVKLTPSNFTVTETAATVKAFSYTDTTDRHVLQLTLDQPCTANAILQGQTLTMALSPCQQAPLLDDTFFKGQTVEYRKNTTIYTFTVPPQVRAARTEWIGTILRLILELS